MEYSRILAPEEHQGLMQALVRGLYYFIGIGTGSVLGGWIIDSQGGGAAGYHLMYRFGAAAMTVWSIAWHLLMALDNWRQGSSSNDATNTASSPLIINTGPK